MFLQGLEYFDFNIFCVQQDPANIQSKHQKHQAFEAELAANAERIQSVLAMGGNLVQRGQCSGSEDAVQVRIVNILYSLHTSLQNIIK